MARIRTIKPEFWTDEKVVELSPLARLLFIGLWNFADDEGRMTFSATRIKLQILPADSADISELLGEIRGKSLIHIYTVDNVEYLQVVGFEKHQKVDKRSPSRLPAEQIVPPNSAELSRRKGREGKGKETYTRESRFDDFWSVYPKKGQRPQCLKKWEAKKLDSIADQIISHVSIMSTSDQWRKENGQFCPNPLTYLNQERWEQGGDGLPPPPPDSPRAQGLVL